MLLLDTPFSLRESSKANGLVSVYPFCTGKDLVYLRLIFVNNCVSHDFSLTPGQLSRHICRILFHLEFGGTVRKHNGRADQRDIQKMQATRYTEVGILTSHIFTGRKALVTFVTAGYPTLHDTVGILKAMQDGGTDIIELGNHTSLQLSRIRVALH